mmetsp:Transcript_18777/g.42905  ORF Transcript_18777/g.42905 Transcript_18777/m.42905 type:complete len:161 (+) Transcript_18777:1617-2099(+)
MVAALENKNDCPGPAGRRPRQGIVFVPRLVIVVVLLLLVIVVSCLGCFAVVLVQKPRSPTPRGDGGDGDDDDESQRRRKVFRNETVSDSERRADVAATENQSRVLAVLAVTTPPKVLTDGLRSTRRGADRGDTKDAATDDTVLLTVICCCHRYRMKVFVP